jgi:hypothetical protein
MDENLKEALIAFMYHVDLDYVCDAGKQAFEELEEWAEEQYGEEWASHVAKRFLD